MTAERNDPIVQNDHVKDLLAVLEGDRAKRLEIFMRAREAFRAIIGNEADHIFNGLFENSDACEKHARCVLGRTMECMGTMTREKAKAIIELGRIKGFGFMTRLIEDAIEGEGTGQASKPELFPEIKVERQSPRFVCGTELISGR